MCEESSVPIPSVGCFNGCVCPDRKMLPLLGRQSLLKLGAVEHVDVRRWERSEVLSFAPPELSTYPVL